MYPQLTDSPAPSQFIEALLSLPPQGLDVVIEQVAAKDCPNTRLPWLKAINHQSRKAVFFPPRCKLWSCPTCGEMNRELWTWRAAHGAKVLYDQGHHLEFVTLTSHEKLDAAGSIKVLPHAWHKVHHRLRRAAPAAQYFLVPEGHKNGRVHLHMITTAHLPKRWWKDAPRACGMGYQSDLQDVRSAGSVAAYIGKYLTKTLQFSNFGRGFRRVRKSQDWPELPELQQPPEWIIYRLPDYASLQGETKRLRQQGYTVATAGSSSAWGFIDQDQGQ